MIIIYNKYTSQSCGEVTHPMTVNEEIEINSIPNFGGVASDYSYIEVPDAYRTKFQRHEWSIENGQIVFGAEKPREELLIEPSLDDYLLDLDFRLSNIELGI